MRSIYEGILPLKKSIQARPDLAKLYADVFAWEPWREVSRCSVCGSFSASSEKEQAACQTAGCSGRYDQPAYPEAETLQYIQKEMAKPEAKGYVKVRMEDVRQTIEQMLAFGWGYQSSAQQFGQEKYRTESMRAVIQDLLVKAGVFFYISEVGVEPTVRLKGLGTYLTRQLADDGKVKNDLVVLRTLADSPMRKISENLGMKPIVGLQTGIRDEENPDRVIFVGRK